VGVAVANFALARLFPAYLLYLGFGTASIGLGIMCCSLVYFVGHGVCGARGGGCLTRLRALVCALAWAACAGALVVLALSPGSSAGNYAAITIAGVFGGLIVGVVIPTALWG
jgi:hypothetical protein